MSHRSIRRKLAGALWLAAALGCGDRAQLPTSPPEAPAPDLSFGRSPILTSWGYGLIDLSTANAGVAKFSYLAIGGPHGGALGVFSQYREAGGFTIDFTGKATCLSVDSENNRAWIGGVILKNRSTHPSFQNPDLHVPGKDVWFRVVDHGTGSGEPRDRSTVLGFIGSAGILTSAEYCQTKPWPGPPTDPVDARTFPLSQGNLVVRP